MAADRDPETPTPSEQVSRLYEQAELEAATAAERLVGSRGFASLLGQMAENAAALTKLGNDAMDLMLRNLRVVGRRDVVQLSRQLGRTEDKLERVLQELEDVRDELRERDRREVSPAPGDEPARTSSSNGATTGSSRARRGGQANRASKGGDGRRKPKESRGPS